MADSSTPSSSWPSSSVTGSSVSAMLSAPSGWMGGESTAVQRVRQAAETAVAAPLRAIRTIVPLALVSTT